MEGASGGQDEGTMRAGDPLACKTLRMWRDAVRDRAAAWAAFAVPTAVSNYLLYWYKSTNTDAATGAAQAAAAALHQFVRGAFAGDKSHVNSEFTCFTATKVQILTLTLLPGSSCARTR